MLAEVPSIPSEVAVFVPRGCLPVTRGFYLFSACKVHVVVCSVFREQMTE